MIQFTDIDGIILGSIPTLGCDLANLICVYTFINRDAAPNYTELSGCFDRAIRAGIMEIPTNGRYCLVQEWAQTIQRWIDEAEVSELGIFGFAEWLLTQEWPEKVKTTFVLHRKDYKKALRGRPVRREVND